MNRIFLPPKAVLLMSVLSLWSISLQTQAQSQPETDSGNGDLNAEDEAVALDDIVVTASLSPISARDVASSITVITREEIEQRQVRFVSDLLRDVPGFSVSQSGGAGAQTQLRVRGAEANQMLVLVDGIRANDAGASDEFQWQYALASDIERIEIVRGPQSAIWGSEALSGVVNIIRKKDSTDRSLTARAEVGSFDTVDLSTDGSWDFGDLRLRGGLAWFDTDGINIARSGDEKDGYDNTTADLGLEWDLTERVSILASGQLVDASNDFDDVDFFVTGLPTDADRVTDAEQSYWGAEVRLAPFSSGWSGSARVNYTDTDNQNFADGEWTSSTAAETFEFRARASLAWDGKGRDQQNRLTVAMDSRDTDFSQRGIASGFGDPNQDQSFDNTGFAAEYVGQLFEGFSWTLSGRHDNYSDFDSIGTWRIAASHQVEENVRVRGSYGTGSKTPTFTERFGFFEDFFVGNPELKPETSRGWEFGVDTDWFDDRLTLGAAYFATALEDEIDGFVFDPGTGGFTAANKADDSDRRGFELTASARFVDGLSLSAGYTYVDATEKDFLGNTVREVRRPRHMGSISANYRFAQDRANLNLNLNYTGEQLDLFFDPQTFVSERVTLDSSTVIDAAGSWRLTDSLELFARVSNLTDEDYEEILGFSRPGRAYYGGLRGRFDF